MKWWLYPALAAAMSVGYIVVPPGTASECTFIVIATSSVLAVIVGILVNRPTRKFGWPLIAFGAALWVLGDTAYFVIPTSGGSVPAPSAADVIYLAGYPMMGVGLYLLVHQGGRRRNFAHLTNSMIVMIAFGLLMWVFVVEPGTEHASTSAGLIDVVYPAMDVFILGLLTQFVGASLWKTTSFRMLAAGVFVVLAADITANLASITAADIGPNVTDIGYLGSYVLVGCAALHPSMRDLGPQKSRSRAASFNTPTVAVVTAAALTAPAAMAILLARGEPVTDWGWGVVLCETVLICLVVLRVTDLLSLLHRQTDTLRAVAETDHLTGLVNRRGLEMWIDGGSIEAGPVAVLLMDIDRFKEINDTFGHSIGDEVLRVVADRLRAVIDANGTVSRLGADEFAVALHGATEADAVAVAQEMHSVLRRPIFVHRATLLVEASVGISTTTEANPNTETLIQQASLAMQSAKTVQPRTSVYDTSMDRDSSKHLLLFSELTAAIDGRQLDVYYQLQVDLAEMKAVGVEALLRWNHPAKGLLEPDSFLPMAERTGLVGPLLDYVLTNALAQRQAWSDDGLDLTLSINISTRNLLDASLVDQVARAVETAGGRPEILTVEITETSRITDLPVAIATLAELRRLGTTLAIDDYGTGYSSLTYLQRLPVQQLKIDKAFVTDMTSTLAHQVIVRSTIDLARALGLTITAEGVEDIETLMALKDLSCNYAQGYYLGRPMPAHEIPSAVTTLNAQLQELIPTS